MVTLGWLLMLRLGVASLLLTAALYLCLLKKEPHGLIRNSCPIILKPYVQRFESSCVFKRWMSRAELASVMPPWAFAYRMERSPQVLVLWLRWFVAYTVIQNGSLLVGDWDESNAFCNVNRDALYVLLLPFHGLEIGEWVEWFFASL